MQKSSARIKVLGSGCAKCTALENNTKEALKLLGKQESVEHITDFAQIASYGVMSTPALVVDNQVVTFGKVLSCDEIKEILLKVGFNMKKKLPLYVCIIPVVLKLLKH